MNWNMMTGKLIRQSLEFAQHVDDREALRCRDNILMQIEALHEKELEQELKDFPSDFSAVTEGAHFVSAWVNLMLYYHWFGVMNGVTPDLSERFWEMRKEFKNYSDEIKRRGG